MLWSKEEGQTTQGSKEEGQTILWSKEEGQTIQWSKEEKQKDKQWFTKHLTENLGLSNIKHAHTHKTRVNSGNKFLVYYWHPSC